MGGCVSLAISCDQAVNSLTRCISGDENPFRNLVDHVASLRGVVRQLEARREDLLRRVKVQEDGGLSRFAEVQEWFSEVEITVRETHDLLLQRDDEIEKLCCSQYCSKTCISSNGYSKKVVKKLKEIEILLSRGVFDEVAQRGPIQKVEERLFHQKIVGQEELIESTWNSIMEDGVGSLGIYGMGGIGKTTLLSQINNKFLIANNQFDIVIWVVVSKKTTVERIQEDIGKRLEIHDEKWERKTKNEKARDINKCLKNKRYVLLLDDIWRKVDLAKIGIPIMSRNRGKIVFTTRSKEVCGRMGVDKEIAVTCMMWDDAWDLFTKSMEETIKNDPDILEVARSIAKKCKGLPLALNVIGDVMARKKTVEEWYHADKLLSLSVAELSSMEAEILSILKFSLTSCISGEKNSLENLEEHVASLRRALRQLKARGEDLLRTVKVQEYGGLSRFSKVQEWFSEFEITVRETHDLLLLRDDEIEKLCCSQYCSKSCISSDGYSKRVDGYSKKVVKKLEEIEILLSRGVFSEVTQRDPIQKVEERLFHQKIVGQEELIESTWNSIMEDGVGILGIYGMGGVGKTTLLSQINNKFLIESNQYDIVIWVVVSKNTTVERIQEDIGKRLEIHDEKWERKTENEKACDINKSLKNKRYVLLLDDIWRKVDLAKIGISVLSRNGSKIVFTTRSNEVCGRMGVDKEIEVTCMMWDDAWDLFTKNMEETIKNDPDILEVARSVAKKCNGLPLALNVIGDVMARKKTVEEWHHATNVLSSSAAEFSGMEAEILSILKFSYDDLTEEKTKACFLFCGLFPEDYEIEKDDLLDYWVGQEFIHGKNEGYAIIGTLIRACLLMETESKDKVKMHDVIRDMALWIPSVFGGPQEQLVFVEENARETPKLKNQEALSSISLMCSRIEKACGSLDCPNLTTVLLQDNRLRDISQDFFCQVPALKVLDLSLNENLTRLPNISHLVSLRYLNLSCTGLKNLPDGLYELCELIYLNLEHTYMLQKINGISALYRLQVLRLYGSGIDTSDSVVDEIRRLKHLYQLTITLRSSSGLESYLKDKRLNSYNKQLYLSGQSTELIVPIKMITSSRVLEILDSNIPKLEIEWPSSDSEDNDQEDTVKIYRPRSYNEDRYVHFEREPDLKDWSSSSKFYSLREVRLDNCTSLQDLTCLLFARHLAVLYLVWLPDICAIIKREAMYARLTGIQPFEELEFLTLKNLGELRSIYWSMLPFPKLKEINIKGCPLLTRLPINSKCPNLQNVVMNAEKEWLEKVEWADEATKERFCPS